jgi:hypothetical protein
MVDLLKISLLTKLIIGRPCLFSCNPCFIELLLESRNFIAQFLVHLVDLGNRRHDGGVELACGFQFEPLLLEGSKSTFHSKLDEEVSQEFV